MYVLCTPYLSFQCLKGPIKLKRSSWPYYQQNPATYNPFMQDYYYFMIYFYCGRVRLGLRMWTPLGIPYFKNEYDPSPRPWGPTFPSFLAQGPKASIYDWPSIPT